MNSQKNYQGFEIGPIRPPSEAGSLMLRVTRNCPWNRCRFCGLYKGKPFSKRPVNDVLKDIDLLKKHMERIKGRALLSHAADTDVVSLLRNTPKDEQAAFHSALNWYKQGVTSVFLQDANTLIIKPTDLITILNHLRSHFPEIERITSYARSHTIARISDSEMAAIAGAGLNRIHIGMESASDQVLAFMQKGVDKATHIKAGQRVKKAGIELSEYFMPGLGGTDLSRANALETADALNQINPDFIRIRSLAVTEAGDLAEDVRLGRFTPLNDVDTARELLLFLEHLEGITSAVRSDHILNLFQEIEGELPEDREEMTSPIKTFLAMPADRQMIYRIGRRTNIFARLSDLENPQLVERARTIQQQYGVTQENLDHFTQTMMRQFI